MNGELNQIQFAAEVGMRFNESGLIVKEIAEKLEISSSAVSQALGMNYYDQQKLNGIRRKILNLMGLDCVEKKVYFIVDIVSDSAKL